METNEIKSTITVFAKAVWNEIKGAWDVEVHQMATHDETCTFGQGATMEQSTNHYEIKECDEFVIPVAILKNNGIDPEDFFKN